MKNEKEQRVFMGVRLKPSLREKILKTCEKENRTMSNVIEIAIEKYYGIKK